MCPRGVDQVGETHGHILLPASRRQVERFAAGRARFGNDTIGEYVRVWDLERIVTLSKRGTTIFEYLVIATRMAAVHLLTADQFHNFRTNHANFDATGALEPGSSGSVLYIAAQIQKRPVSGDPEGRVSP